MSHPLVENNYWSIMMKRYATPPGRKQLLVYNDEEISPTRGCGISLHHYRPVIVFYQGVWDISSSL
jgi:hypothetical protein